MDSTETPSCFFQDCSDDDIESRLADAVIFNYPDSWEYSKFLKVAIFDILKYDYGDDPRVRTCFKILCNMLETKVMDIEKFLKIDPINLYVREHFDEANSNLADTTVRFEIMKSGAVKLRPCKRRQDFKMDEAYEAITTDSKSENQNSNSKKKKTNKKSKTKTSKKEGTNSTSAETSNKTDNLTANVNHSNVNTENEKILQENSCENNDHQSTENMDCQNANSGENATKTNTTNGEKLPTAKTKYDLFFLIDDNYKTNLENILQIQPNVIARTLDKHIHIRSFDSESYHKIQNFCKNIKLPFRTMDPRCDRPRKVLFRGLPWTTPVEDIADAISNINLIPLKIAYLRSRKSFNKGQPLNLFVATVAFGQNFEKIYDIENINHLAVTVTYFKSPKYRQCYNCQAWGHSSLSCNFSSVCLKCAKNHHTKDCSRKKDEPLKCCHCSLEHASNWLGCSFHPAFKNKNKTQNSKSENVKPTTFPNSSNTQNSKSKILKTKNIESKTNKNSNNILVDNQNSKSPDLTSLEDFPPITINHDLEPASTNIEKNQTENKIEPSISLQQTKTHDDSSTEEPSENYKTNTRLTGSDLQNFMDLFEIFKEIHKFFKNYNQNDIKIAFQDIAEVFKNKDSPLMDKIFQICEIITNLTNGVTNAQ